MIAWRTFTRDAETSRLEIAEAVVAGGVILMLSGALIGPVFDPDQLGGDVIGWLRLTWLPVYAAIVGLAAWRWAEIAQFWRPALIFAALAGLAAASMLWAVDPGTTGRRALALAFTTLFGLYLPARFGGVALCRLLAATFALMASGALVVCLAAPSLGVDHDVNAGAWKGLWYEKNAMGTMMAYGAMAGAAAAVADARRRMAWVMAATVCGGLVLTTHSVTALIVLAGALASIGLLRWARRGPIAGLASAWLGVTLAAGVALAATLSPDSFYRLVGKEPTITGRTDIWRAAGQWAGQAPWLGYGYEGFWNDGFAPAQYVRAQLGWLVPNAHNSWLDIRLELGWVGFAVVVALFIVAAAAVLARGWRMGDAGWSATFFVTFIFSALFETLIMEQNSLAWALCVAAIARLLGPSPGERFARASVGSAQAAAPVAGVADRIIVGARG